MENERLAVHLHGTTPERIKQIQEAHLELLAHGPLNLCDIARINIRKAIGAIHFQERVGSLPLPPALQNFVIGRA